VLVISAVGVDVAGFVVPDELEQPAHMRHTIRSIPVISKNFEEFFIYYHYPAGLLKTVSTKKRDINVGTVAPFSDPLIYYSSSVSSRTVNSFWYVYDWPSGLVITTLHGPTAAVLGISNVTSIWESESKVTLDAVIVEEPDLVSFTVGVSTKLYPVIVEVTVSLIYPSSGSISLKEGFEAVVVVAVVVTRVVTAVVLTVAAVEVVVAGAAVGTDATVTRESLTVYTFSITDLLVVSVSALIRYPHVPSLFL